MLKNVNQTCHVPGRGARVWFFSAIQRWARGGGCCPMSVVRFEQASANAPFQCSETLMHFLVPPWFARVSQWTCGGERTWLVLGSGGGRLSQWLRHRPWDSCLGSGSNSVTYLWNFKRVFEIIWCVSDFSRSWYHLLCGWYEESIRQCMKKSWI